MCINCKNILREGLKYCSVKCQKEYERLNIINSGKADIRTLKLFLLRKNGNKCEICNLSEWMNKPIPLVLDHINGDSEDKSLKNARLICCNCDAQTPTYKGRNKGNGRHYRRLRYALGKSY